MPDLLTTTEVAAYLRLNIQTVQAYVRAGRFPNARQIGRKYLIPASDVEALLNPAPVTLAPRKRHR